MIKDPTTKTGTLYYPATGISCPGPSMQFFISKETFGTPKHNLHTVLALGPEAQIIKSMFNLTIYKITFIKNSWISLCLSLRGTRCVPLCRSMQPAIDN